MKEKDRLHFDIVIVGGGAAGISVAASLLSRDSSLNLAIVEPSDKHYYQAAFTLVGADVFDAEKTLRNEGDCIPSGVKWIHGAVEQLKPNENVIIFKSKENGLKGTDELQKVSYDYLIVCPGLSLKWDEIDGLEATIGKNGVCSNYQSEYAQYTRECLSSIGSGKLIFTQPPMPIKCAGAPQKIMYLTGNVLEKQGRSDQFDLAFHTATPALFGVADFVPSLMNYINRYHVDLNLSSNLVAIDGASQRAIFRQGDKDVVQNFEVIHVVPPQASPAFIANSPCSDDNGWLDVDQFTLQSKTHDNIFGLGDVINAPNAKTAAAVRQQVPVVCENLLASMRNEDLSAGYNGYGACPLTVEHGRVVLAEFGYGGKLLPSFPVDNTRPSRMAWILKRHIMPYVYWDLMLKGREWLAKASRLDEVRQGG